MLTSWFLSLGLVAAFLVGASDLNAQVIQDDLVGKRVRVSADGTRSTGNLIAVLPDSLILLTTTRHRSDDRFAIPVGRITRFEVSIGRHRNTGKGALIGLVAGSLIGLAAASNDPNNFLGPGGQAMVVGITGALGAGLGALFGAFPIESWEDVPLE
jgi:hypothetical protein